MLPIWWMGLNLGVVFRGGSAISGVFLSRFLSCNEGGSGALCSLSMLTLDVIHVPFAPRESLAAWKAKTLNLKQLLQPTGYTSANTTHNYNFPHQTDTPLQTSRSIFQNR